MINHLGGFCLRSLSLNSMRSNCLLSNLASVCVCECVCLHGYLKHFISADTPQSKCVSVCVCVRRAKLKSCGRSAFLIARDNAKSVAYFRGCTILRTV